MIALVALGLIAGTALAWWGSGRLEESSGRLANHYALPDVVRGTLVVAVGSSFPELSAAVLSTLVHGEFELGMSTIVGSAIFNVLVIPAVAGFAGGKVSHGLRVVYRDAQFYLTSVAVTLLTFSLALIYHPLPAEGGGRSLSGSITRPIAMIPLLLYGLYLFLQHQETKDHWRARRGDSPRDDGMEAEPATDPGPSDDVRPGREWTVLAASLGAILVGVELLLRAVLELGERLDVPSFVWGVTIVAAATSLPDTLVSYRAARAGEAEVSLGNVLGSNIFDLLVALPAGLLIAGATPVDFGVAAPLVGMLTLATIVLFAVARIDLALDRRDALLLMALYVLFVAWAIAESAGWVSWIPA